MDFLKRLDELSKQKNSCLCVGLDPFFEKSAIKARGLDACIQEARESNIKIIEATAPHTVCYKPNIAFYEALGEAGMELLRATIAAVPEDSLLLIDAKRGDIGSTARAYAQAVFGSLGADAVTLNPYLGKESIEPFMEWKDKGLFLLCRTSNPGSAEFQDLPSPDEPLYIKVARSIVSWSENLGIVVAGNDIEALGKVRAVAPQAWFLSPGIGAQGGNARDALLAGARADGKGVLVVAARSISGAKDPGLAAEALKDEINRASAEAEKVSPRVSGWEAPGNDGGNLKDAFVAALIDTSCFRLGDFTLKSGAKSPFYIDLRRLISNPEALALAGQAYASLAKKCRFQRIAGIPAAALPLATSAALALQQPMIWPRMPVKDHGTGNRVEGEYVKGERVLLLDDLITTGLSKKEAVDILRGEGLVVEDLVVLVERGRNGRADMEKSGIRLHAFLQVEEIIATLYRLGRIGEAERLRVENYLKEE